MDRELQNVKTSVIFLVKSSKNNGCTPFEIQKKTKNEDKKSLVECGIVHDLQVACRWGATHDISTHGHFPLKKNPWVLGYHFLEKFWLIISIWQKA